MYCKAYRLVCFTICIFKVSVKNWTLFDSELRAFDESIWVDNRWFYVCGPFFIGRVFYVGLDVCLECFSCLFLDVGLPTGVDDKDVFEVMEEGIDNTGCTEVIEDIVLPIDVVNIGPGDNEGDDGRW